MGQKWRKVALFGLAVLFILVQPEEVGECKEGEWRCGDRSCAGVGAACDGALQCADGSDEALLLCRGTKRPLLGLLLLCLEAAPAHAALCPDACRRWPDYCSYALLAEHGAPGTCILPSFPSVGSYSVAELSPRGAGAADFSLAYSCPEGYRQLGSNPRCEGGAWTAGFPTCVPASSPAISAVFGNGKKCSEQQFMCADGACVTSERRCDGEPDCADGSDERGCAGADDSTAKKCVLPAYPHHGSYSVLNQPSTAPGQALATATLVVTCDPGFEVMGDNFFYCVHGTWSTDEIPQCSQCGTVAPTGLQLRRSVDNSHARRGEIPWHAGIYDKTITPFRQICGGSLVSTTVVISAAHCFMSYNSLAPVVEKYAVALGKIYRPWNDRMDSDAQKSDVKSIKVPSHFMGARANYQDDISLVVLAEPVVYNTHVRPVCLDFSPDFDKVQLDTSLGKVAGWGLTSEDGDPSPVLKTKELLYVDLLRCLEDLPRDFVAYVTSDKICADPIKGTIICKGDSGGGLAFPTVDGRGVQRYYLRGVVSTAPATDHKCDVKSHILFTHILKHQHFIKGKD